MIRVKSDKSDIFKIMSDKFFKEIWFLYITIALLLSNELALQISISPNSIAKSSWLFFTETGMKVEKGIVKVLTV